MTLNAFESVSYQHEPVPMTVSQRINYLQEDRGGLDDSYLNGTTARLTLTALESTGITLTDRTLYTTLQVTFPSSDRLYGNFPMQYSRLISEFIGSPGTFDMYADVSSLQLDVLEPKRQIPVMGNAFTDQHSALLEDIIKRSIKRPPFKSSVKTLEPRHGDKLHIGIGSCRDSEGYFNTARQEDELYYTELYDTPFITKNVHDQTLISLEEVVYKGITLPKGWLFNLHDTKKALIALRASAYSYPPAIAEDAFHDSVQRVSSADYERTQFIIHSALDDPQFASAALPYVDRLE